MEVLVMSRGLMKAIYAEEIPIQLLGHVQIVRASLVEPDANGQWWADLTPSQGPILGPFAQRSMAIDAELEWLTANVIFQGRDISPDELPTGSQTDEALIETTTNAETMSDLTMLENV